MEFRPCIDIHNGKVKQIIGGSLKDQNNEAVENYVSEQDAAFFAEFYKKDGIKGGHIILLNPQTSEYYEHTKEQAMKALRTYPGGLQIGGGINNENAQEFLDAGASHVIVTSYVFKNGEINRQNLEKLVCSVGKEHLVLDLSCRKKEGKYYIVTDRWQKFTNVVLDTKVLSELSQFSAEFLIHAVDVEGKAKGIEKELVQILGKWNGIPTTYAGGVGNFQDLMQLKELGNDRVNVTIGSALNLFGGNMRYKEVLKMIHE